MSWLERLNTIQLSIITGDGKEYSPLWKDAEKNINYNVEGFDFIGVEGTYVARKEKSGIQYPMTLYFQGENNIDISDAFEISARDKRPWTIKHPYYGEFKAQPLSLSFNNKFQNVTEITGTLWQTIDEKYPEQSISTKKDVEIKKQELDTTVEDSFSNALSNPNPSIIEPGTTAVQRIGKNYEKLKLSTEQAAELKNEIASASALVQNIVSDQRSAIQQIISLINFPFETVQDIRQKIDAYIITLNDLIGVFLKDSNGDFLPTPGQNATMYQSYSATVFGEMSRSAVNGNFQNRKEVVTAISQINEAYNQYLSNIDTIGLTEGYDISQKLDVIINQTIASLFDVAFESKQERVYTIDKDENIITLAHRFYGQGDDNIMMFILQNDVKLSEYVTMKKGRQIVYFV